MPLQSCGPVEPAAEKSTPKPPKSPTVKLAANTPFAPTWPGRARGVPSGTTCTAVETLLAPPLKTKKPAGAPPSKVAVLGGAARADAAARPKTRGGIQRAARRRDAAVAIFIGPFLWWPSRGRQAVDEEAPIIRPVVKPERARPPPPSVPGVTESPAKAPTFLRV